MPVLAIVLGIFVLWRLDVLTPEKTQGTLPTYSHQTQQESSGLVNDSTESSSTPLETGSLGKNYAEGTSDANSTEQQQAIAVHTNNEATEAAESTTPPEQPAVVVGEIKSGDTAEEILSPFMDGQTFYEMLQASKAVHPLSRIREGQPYTVVREPETGTVESFLYEIDSNKMLAIDRTETGFSARLQTIEYDVERTVVRGEITSSLFQAIAATGENPDLAVHLATIFGSEINFIKDLRKGDSFIMVVEKRFRDGEFRNYGRVKAARFINEGKAYEGYLYASESGASRYFNSKGESLAKTLLKAPLSFTRVTSGYSMGRKHPVYFDKRPHQGVDYGAPTGTPVKAVGDGLVNKAGWGNGFGNMVILRHEGGLESMYSHLSGFAKGMRAGTRVRQGQVIAYVGSTGVSTGPHLDFRLKQNGRYVNPTKFVAPRGNPVPKGSRGGFELFVKEMKTLMNKVS